MSSLRLLPELEESLRRVPGIRAASVVTDPDGKPTEIHVVASRSKNAKQVVRDVQSLAFARHGIEVDHRIISVVQFEDDELPIPSRPIELPPRPVISSISIRIAGSEADVCVGVDFGNDHYEGRSLGAAAMNQRHMLVARATLDAVAELLGMPAEIEYASVLTMGGRRLAACVVQISVPRVGELALSGSALVRNDEADAVARAVLDALNRRLSG
ncbi:MAG: hypothetical protein IRZ02_03160 [Acidothermus sp.]|nr:hypothetical protein [Acidothermus sp.]MCL6538601.1 hypothetical protein [Acidothermus sp.]